MSKSATASLIATSDAYCAAVGLSRSRVSTVIFNDGKALDRIAAGGDLQTRSYEKAMAWFDANWPEGVKWPEGVERPKFEAAAAAPAEQGAAA